ncbi:unnamed protein product [Closterium sp. Naga37s-1]|nr:unnamed protein product [Closterium sp. Naga37s-1]
MPHAPVAHAILPALMEHVSYPMSFSPPPLAAASALAGSSHAAAAAAASHGGVPVVSLVSVLAGGGTDVAALTLFVGLLCACIVVGHVLEGVRWINDAVTAILFVSAPSPPLHARPLLRLTITRAMHPRLSPSLASLLRWPPLRFLLTPSVRPFRAVALCVSSSRASSRLRAASSSFPPFPLSPLPPFHPRQGLASGTVVLFVRGGASSMILRFDEDLFFIYLLPPIIFNAGFQMKKKQFFRNFGGIMAYGIAGVFISVSVITAGCNFLFPLLGLPIQPSHIYLALGVIFSATDSVSVLQVLDQEEQPLVYSLVFGEGVVNDATSIVLFRAVQQLALSPAAHALSLATLLNVLSDFLYLFTASTMLGVALGLLSAYVMKTLYFSSHATDREIALMALMAYASYILAEVLRLSGILSVFFAGIVMSHYTWHNVTESSRVTTKHAFATMSFIAETVIFMYVGMDALDSEKWTSVNVRDTFVLFTLLLGLVLAGRAAFVFPLSALLNLQRKHSRALRPPHQVVIWWAGLMRGAVSIALTYSAFSEEGEATAAMLIASTIALVLFSTLLHTHPFRHASPLVPPFLPCAPWAGVWAAHESAHRLLPALHSPPQCQQPQRRPLLAQVPPPPPISPASTTLFLAASPSLPPSRSRPFSTSTPATSVSSAPSVPAAPSAPDAAPAVPSAPVRATPPRPRLLYPHGAAGHVEGDMVVCLPASSMAGLPMPDARLASRILSAHERDLHDLWRWLDDTYMRPLFGGRGYVAPAARPSSFSLPRSSSGLAGAAARMLLQGGGGGSMFERLDARAVAGREEEGEVKEGEGEEEEGGDGMGRGSRRASFVRFADEIGEERREGRGRLEEEGDAVEGECLAEDDVAWPHKMGHNLPHHPHQLHHHHHHHHQQQQQHHQGNHQQQHEGQKHGSEWEGEGEAPWRIGEERT